VTREGDEQDLLVVVEGDEAESSNYLDASPSWNRRVPQWAGSEPSWGTFAAGREGAGPPEPGWGDIAADAADPEVLDRRTPPPAKRGARPLDAASRTRRRRWRLAGALAVAAIGLVEAALWVRATVDASAARRLASFVGTAQQLDQSRREDLVTMGTVGTPSDLPGIRAAAPALYLEEAQAFSSLAARTRGVTVLLSGRLVRLRATEAASLATMAATLRGDGHFLAAHPQDVQFSGDVLDALGSSGGQASGQPAIGSSPVLAGTPDLLPALGRLGGLVRAAEQGLSTSPPRGPAVHLTAANAELDRLRQLLSQPSRDTLLLVGPEAVTQLDLGRDVSGPANVDFPGVTFDGRDGIGSVIARPGWAAAVVVSFAESAVFSTPANLNGPGQLLAVRSGAVALAPARSPNAVWVLTLDQAEEVTRTGKVLEGPVTVPDNLVPTGLAAGQDLLLASGPSAGSYDVRSLVAWDPRTGRTHLLAAGRCTLPLAGGGDVIAWGSCGPHGHPDVVHELDLATGRTTTTRVPPGLLLDNEAEGALTPVGDRLALEGLSASQPGAPGSLVLVSAGRNGSSGLVARVVPGAPMVSSTPDLTWAPDGRRLVFLTPDTNATVATWEVGTPTSVDIRYNAANNPSLSFLGSSVTPILVLTGPSA
jgi:hypothetical protein